jgi:hypothetical protein
MSPEIKKKVDDFISEMGEHFESARFFGSFNEGNGETGSYTSGSGNFHAQYGQIREWITRQDEMVRMNARP